jgi:hypothetical protein
MLEALVGQKKLIRTVTYFILGEVVAVEGSFVTVNNASWVADTGRLGVAITQGKLNESEYIGDGVLVNLDSAVDILPWAHELPTATI